MILPANPLLHVSNLVEGAYESLVNASSALNPIQALVYEPGGRKVMPDLAASRSHARAGVEQIETALGFTGSYSQSVADALGSARTEAIDGVSALDAKYLVAVDYGQVVAPRFDAAAHWLNIAGDLLALEGGLPFRPFAA
jgi:hypothetical protein